MKVSEAIKNRYSCRSYSDKKVPEKLLLDLLELANQAPSAANQQNREFIIITNKENKKYLAKMNNQPHLEQAPVVILATTKLSHETVADYLKLLENWEMTVQGIAPDKFKATKEFEDELKEMKYKWMIQDVAASIENLMLAAIEKGLATCWLGVMDFQGIIEKFRLPKNVVPVCLITLGYEKEPPKYRTLRKPITELIHWEKYQ